MMAKNQALLADFDDEDLDNEDDLDNALDDEDFDLSALDDEQDQEAPDSTPTLPGPQHPPIGSDHIAALGDPAATAPPRAATAQSTPVPQPHPAAGHPSGASATTLVHSSPGLGLPPPSRQVSNDIVHLEGLKLKWQASANDFRLLGEDEHVTECIKVGLLCYFCSG
jgi:hypothetical protein